MTTRGKKKATKTQHNEKMSILGYLKQMLNRINIGLIVAILSLIAAIVVPIIIYQWQKKDNDSNNSIKSEIELLKDSIAMNIAEIENTFHPEQIPIDIENDTIELKGKFTAIRDYQTHVLDFITNYGVIEASPSLTEVYKNTYKDEDEVRRIHDNITTNVRRFFISYDSIITNMETLDYYGTVYDVSNYKTNRLMYIKLEELSDLMEIQALFIQRSLLMLSNVAYTENGDTAFVINVPPGNESEVKRIVNEDLGITWYRFCNYALKFYIHQNKKYQIAIRHYQLDESKNKGK